MILHLPGESVRAQDLTVAKMREIMTDIAHSFNLDPLLAATWNAITRNDIKKTEVNTLHHISLERSNTLVQRGKAILNKFDSYASMTCTLFPSTTNDSRVHIEGMCL
jgi:hypothetical protein